MKDAWVGLSVLPLVNIVLNIPKPSVRLNRDPDTDPDTDSYEEDPEELPERKILEA
jgi:hypothetical protein